MSYQIITNRKITVSVIGCGRISANHFKSLAQFKDDFELVAICDTDETVRLEHSTRYNVPGFAEAEEMFRSVKSDLVILCTPTGLHPTHTILAAKFGSNVLSEKPMATLYSQGVTMQEACDAAKVRLFVVKQNRANATIQLLKRALDENRFGDIKMVHLNVFWTRPQAYYDQAAWRGTWEMDGGAFMNQASHYVDLMSWLIGPISSVHAFTSTTRDIEAEDTGVVNVKWDNGAIGSMAVTMLTYPKNLEGSITILGEKGSARIGGVAVNEIQVWDFDESKDYDDDIRNANYETTSVYGFGHPLYYANVKDVLRGVAEPQTDGRSGLVSLELIEAIYRSAKSQRVINLPLDNA